MADEAPWNASKPRPSARPRWSKSKKTWALWKHEKRRKGSSTHACLLLSRVIWQPHEWSHSRSSFRISKRHFLILSANLRICYNLPSFSPFPVEFQYPRSKRWPARGCERRRRLCLLKSVGSHLQRHAVRWMKLCLEKRQIAKRPPFSQRSR